MPRTDGTAGGALFKPTYQSYGIALDLEGLDALEVTPVQREFLPVSAGRGYHGFKSAFVAVNAP